MLEESCQILRRASVFENGESPNDMDWIHETEHPVLTVRTYLASSVMVVLIPVLGKIRLNFKLRSTSFRGAFSFFDPGPRIPWRYSRYVPGSHPTPSFKYYIIISIYVESLRNISLSAALLWPALRKYLRSIHQFRSNHKLDCTRWRGTRNAYGDEQGCVGDTWRRRWFGPRY